MTQKFNCGWFLTILVKLWQLILLTGVHLIFNLDQSQVTAPFIPYLENEIELDNERHTYSEFHYETGNTNMEIDWERMPTDMQATLRESKDLKECQVRLKLHLRDYKTQRIICLYKDTKWARTLNTTIDVDGKTYTREEFMQEITPVKGFVVYEMNSLVKGYIIDGEFFGTIRIYDVYTAYHIHYYVEPVEVANSYTKHALVLRHPNDNAVVFEYVGHDAEVGAIRPPEDIAKEQYEIQRNETGGPILTEFGGMSYTVNITEAKKAQRQATAKPKRHAEDEHDDEVVTTTKAPISRQAKSPGEQRRKDAAAKLVERTPDEITVAYHDDVAGIMPLLGGVTDSDIFDTSSGTASVCTLCVWMEPLFAFTYGFELGNIYAAAEILEILRRQDWIYRAMDFNIDGVAENFGFIIKTFLVSDEFNLTQHRQNRRKKRNAESTAHGHKHTSTKSPLPDVGPTEPGAHNVSHPAKQAKPKKVYRNLLKQMSKHPKFQNCCAMIAFVQLDLTPVVSVSTIRGLCSTDNLVVIGGLLHGHKLGIFDIQRALFHGFGHMMGAEHDKIMRSKCQDRKPSKFYNPFIMHPVQQANVGLRPNSFRMSSCSKLEITAFLDSTNLKGCLIRETDDFCGNGMLDPGEECDCGSAWQCHLQECCGESDTIFRCRVNRLGRQMKCDRPTVW